jgi:hypothetical protein
VLAHRLFMGVGLSPSDNQSLSIHYAREPLTVQFVKVAFGRSGLERGLEHLVAQALCQELADAERFALRAVRF